MPNKVRNYEEELNNLTDGMAEYALGMSDEEIRSEILDEGDDPDRSAEETRDVLRRAVKAYKQRELLQAQKRYEDQVASFGGNEHTLPESMEGQREMLMNILAGNTQMRPDLLTAQNRDFKNLPDSEVTSYLKQLLNLAALDDQTSVGEGRK
jgi:hypothetical protein